MAPLEATMYITYTNKDLRRHYKTKSFKKYVPRITSETAKYILIFLATYTLHIMGYTRRKENIKNAKCRN